MLRSKATVFGMIAALILMTGAFTALSSDGTSGSATAADIDEFVLVNGHEVAEADFVTRVAAVEQNMLTLRTQSETAPDGGALAESILDIMVETPVETIALASLILDKAIYQEAIERGHLPDEQVIAQQVDQERTMFEMIEENPEQFGIAQEDVDRYRANIEDIGGEERYWNEFYPQVMEQQIAVQQLQMTAGQEGEDWIQIQRQAFNGAEVQVGDPDRIAPATVSAAGDYLHQVWNVFQNEETG
jgi:parvulin-like peptidyl-prolyl isomerase